MHIDELDTPFLMVDLDALEENLDRYQAYFREHELSFRPHIKTHKTLAIAGMQLQRGAVGLTCQKLGEVEVMVDAHDTDYLLTYNILGQPKLERLVALARRTPITVVADNDVVVRGLSQAASAAGIELPLLIEVEMGFRRTGAVSPQAGAELAGLADSLPGLRLRGIMGFPTGPETRPLIQETTAAFDAAGLCREVVSGGSSLYAMQAHEIPELTEYRAGEYVVGGATHLLEGRHTVEQCAVRAVTTVVSRPDDERACLDAGSKTMSACVLQTDHGPSLGYLVEYPDVRFNGVSEEHGHLDISGCDRKPEIGERVQVLPVHPCPCINEHDQVYAVRDGQVEEVWPVAARGRVR